MPQKPSAQKTILRTGEAMQTGTIITVLLILSALATAEAAPIPIKPTRFTVEGTVFEPWPGGRGSDPLNDVSVRMQVEDQTALTGYRTIDSTASNGDGTYTFTDTFATGNYRIEYTKDGYYPLHLNVHLTRDTTLVGGLLPEGATGTIAGRAIEACVDPPCPRIPTPVAGCSVSVVIGPRASDTLSTVTDLNGYFTFDAVPVYPADWERTYTVIAQAPAFEPDTAAATPAYGLVDSVSFPLIPLGSSVQTHTPTDAAHFAVRRTKHNTIAVSLPTAALVRFEAFGIDGRAIAISTASRRLPQGNHRISFDYPHHWSGTVLLRASCSGGVRVVRLGGRDWR